jgi:hypothetical protein
MSLKQTLEKIKGQRKAVVHATQRRKKILYGAGVLLLLVAALYFLRQFNSILQGGQTTTVHPIRIEKLDTTASRGVALTKLYEQEEKNRYQDSMALLHEERALGYIVMDWENLYDVRKKEAKKLPPAKSPAPDSLNAILRLVRGKDSTQDSTRLAAALVAAPAKREQKEGSAGRAARVRGAGQKQARYPKEGYISVPVDPFNTVHASGPTLGAYPAARTVGPIHTGLYAGNAYESPAASGLIPAVVHGEHKVKPRGKVTFRTLEDAAVNGVLLPKNTLVVGIADFKEGRMMFSSFRAKTDGKGIALPFDCYNSDWMAGISYGDQPFLETEMRKGALTAMTDAAEGVSASIPYGALARATSNLARGVLRGSARGRGGFIYLSDGYKVFFEPQTGKK